jgi:hypothetical protein
MQDAKISGDDGPFGHRDERDREFLMTGIQTPILLEPADATFHHVAAAIGLSIEVRLDGLIRTRGNHHLNAALLQVAADPRVAVAFVAGDTLWPTARSSQPASTVASSGAAVVCAWLGNSERIAQEHYLQVTDAHFERTSHFGSQGSMAEIGGNDGKATEPKSPNSAENRVSVE